MYRFAWLWQLAIVLGPLKFLLNLQACPIDKADLVSGKVGQTAKLQMQTNLCLWDMQFFSSLSKSQRLWAEWLHMLQLGNGQTVLLEVERLQLQQSSSLGVRGM